MYALDAKKCVTLMLCISVISSVMCSVLPNGNMDPDLDTARAVVLAEKEVRLLEKDLNGDGEYISEEDMLLLTIMVRNHLHMMPYIDLYSNPVFVREEAGKVMGLFVAKRAQQHAKTMTNNSRIIANAAKVESHEFMSLLQQNPLRKGRNLYHYFGNSFETRVKENIMNGRKYY